MVSGVRYVIRMDDACPTMAQSAWRELEALFEELDIRPIAGVIPDCTDPKMLRQPTDPGFWDQVRRWQARKWVIALHGLHHAYHPDPPHAHALVNFHKRGGFVGLPLDRQQAIIRSSLAILWRENVEPAMFMAPSHSFDHATLEALRRESGIRWITDGISHRSFQRWGFHWLPQQIWDFRNWLPFGTWTICLHPNSMTQDALRAFAQAARRNRDAIIDPPLREAVPSYGIADRAFAALYWTRHQARQGAAALLKRA